MSRILICALEIFSPTCLKLGTHYPRVVFTGCVHGREHGCPNDAGVHGPCTRRVNTGVKNDTHVHGPVNTACGNG